MPRPSHWCSLVLTLVATAAAFAQPAEPVLADLYLQSGLRLRGEVTVLDTEVVFRNAAGEMRYPRDAVVSVVPVPATPAPTLTIDEPPPPEGETPPETEPATEGDLSPAPLISKRDIQRLRLHELILTGPAEQLKVNFLKGPRERDLPELVLEELRAQPNFDPNNQEVLTRGRPGERLQAIVRETGMKYADRIDVQSDPEVFQAFKKQVLPLINESCARSGCHWGSKARVFRLPVGARTNDPYAYTVFTLLDGMETTRGRLIDRDQPEDSLLLHYLLPQENNARAHPEVGRGPAFKAPLKGMDDPQYRAVMGWVKFLMRPRPDYGLEYQHPYPYVETPARAAEPPAAAPPTTRPAERATQPAAP